VQAPMAVAERRKEDGVEETYQGSRTAARVERDTERSAQGHSPTTTEDQQVTHEPDAQVERIGPSVFDDLVELRGVAACVPARERDEVLRGASDGK
jgi:hypothetical protein